AVAPSNPHSAKTSAPARSRSSRVPARAGAFPRRGPRRRLEPIAAAPRCAITPPYESTLWLVQSNIWLNTRHPAVKRGSGPEGGQERPEVGGKGRLEPHPLAGGGMGEGEGGRVQGGPPQGLQRGAGGGAPRGRRPPPPVGRVARDRVADRGQVDSD